jgi:predicted nuclease with TOPRIM domain
MINKFILCVVLVILSACSYQNQNKDELEALNERITTLELELEKAKKENSELNDQNIKLKQLFEGYDYNDAISFKDTIKLEAKVLHKQEGDDLYPYYIIVTMADRDHNTPLLLTTDSKDTYDQV